mmetsp:Transcript_92954/g.165300  ORF Transcript_92954/g.165300 Transcript_92954/m.165300 type:complete len:704 (+) Transcript_92954:27-2138(+)
MSSKAALAAQLARSENCSEELASAALAKTRNVAQAARLLKEGPLEVYEANQPVGSKEHGDAVFEHPYVQCLLEAAGAKVSKTLKAQSGLAAEKFLICVRTYGRAVGKKEKTSEIKQILNETGWPAKDKDKVEEKLRAAGIEDLKALQTVVKKKSLATCMTGSHQQRIDHLASIVEAKSNFNDKLKLNQMGILDMTLAALERALGPEAFKLCLIFASHEDPAVTSGKYAAALKGTPWEDRVVMGVKGAHLQVRFIEESCPKGTHVVVADDNILDFVVEQVSEEAIAKKKAEKGCNEMMRELDSKFTESPVAGLGLDLVEETDFQSYLRRAWQRRNKTKPKADDVKAWEVKLQKVGIKTISQLQKSLEKKKVDGIFDELELKALLLQRDEPLPPRKTLAVPSNSPKAPAKLELVQLIQRAGRTMKAEKSNLWSVNPSKNHFWLRGNGEQTRKRTQKTGYFEEYSVKLGLAYGAFFGFRVLHEASLYTRYGQVKDDVERSLRYWHRDKVILRFSRYGVVKSHKPGVFKASKGGISALSSAEKHQQEGTKALQGMLEDFASKYARLAEEGDRSSTGLVWQSEERHDFKKTQKEKAARKEEQAAGSEAGIRRRWKRGSLTLQASEEEKKEEEEVASEELADQKKPRGRPRKEPLLEQSSDAKKVTASKGASSSSPNKRPVATPTSNRRKLEKKAVNLPAAKRQKTQKD